MTVGISGFGPVRQALLRGGSVRSATDMLRVLVIGAGLLWSILFVVVGVRYKLQMYGDGSIFSYAVAVQDAWGFHWHNILGRLFVYLFSIAPAEAYVALTDDAYGGIALYGCLFFLSQLLGLAATFAADRSNGRVIFTFACLSTAVLCPLVFGFPTEMWMAHALFWPTLALCHYARTNTVGNSACFFMLAALAFTHEGALVLELFILGTLMLRGARDAAFLRAAGAFLVVLAARATVYEMFPPDDHIAPILGEAALHFFDVARLACPELLLLFATLAGYGIAFLVLRRLTPARAHVYAALIVLSVLVAYWMRFDHAIHASNRYYLRTALLIATPLFGALATAYALAGEAHVLLQIPSLRRLLTTLRGDVAVRAAAGAFVLVMTVHAIETAKFVTSWTSYRASIRALAQGAASDPVLGNPRFVSSERMAAQNLKQLSWNSTTPFLSVLVAPAFAPARLVVDPGANYFWLSCETAIASERSHSAVPVESRRLVREHACLHR